jgi:hypothetical protein
MIQNPVRLLVDWFFRRFIYITQYLYSGNNWWKFSIIFEHDILCVQVFFSLSRGYGNLNHNHYHKCNTNQMKNAHTIWWSQRNVIIQEKKINVTEREIVSFVTNVRSINFVKWIWLISKTYHSPFNVRLIQRKEIRNI